MTSLNQHLAIIGCLQGLLLALMLTLDKRVSDASRLLGVFCFLLGLSLLQPFLTYSIAPSQLYWLAAWIFFFPVAFGPLFYLYCRNALLDSRLRAKDLLHALPLLGCYLLNIDTMIWTNEDFRAWIIGSQAPSSRAWFSEYILFISAIVYSVATVRVIWRYQKRAGDTLSNYNPAKFKWMWLLFISTFTIWSLKGVLSFTPWATPGLLALSDALIVLIIYVIAYMQWRSPKLFTVDDLTAAESSAAPDTKPAEEKLSQSDPRDDQDRASLFAAVKQVVETKALYRDSDLTLAGLSEATGLGTHHLSEVLNKQSGKNFNQFINDYRIAYVCERLQSGSEENILDLAMDAGFASKSTFNTMFKKSTGSTPSQYRKGLNL